MTFWPVGVPDSGAPESVALLLETQARNVPFPASGRDIWTPAAILQPWGALVCDKSTVQKEVQVKESYIVGPDSSGPAAILLLDSSHALVLLSFKDTWVALFSSLQLEHLSCTKCIKFPAIYFSAVMKFWLNYPPSFVCFDKMREGLERGGEERDIKWLHGSASSADMHSGAGRKTEDNLVCGRGGGHPWDMRGDKQYLNHNILKQRWHKR